MIFEGARFDSSGVPKALLALSVGRLSVPACVIHLYPPISGKETTLRKPDDFRQKERLFADHGTLQADIVVSPNASSGAREMV